MITFTSLGGATIQCAMDKKTLVAFPSDEKQRGDITLISTPEEEPSEGMISWPGEYDMEGIAIRGIGHDEGRQSSFTVSIDGVRCAFLSSPLQDLTDHELELLGDVDVLMVPTDDHKIVQKLIDEIDPRILIPLPTKDKKEFEDVLKSCGAQGSETVDEYKIKGSLPAEGRVVVVLKPRK